MVIATNNGAEALLSPHSIWAAAILSKKAASLQGSPIQCKYVDQAFKEAQAATLLYLPHYEVMTGPQSVHRSSGDLGV